MVPGLEQGLVSRSEDLVVDEERHPDRSLAVAVRALARELDQPLQVDLRTVRRRALVFTPALRVVLRPVHGIPGLSIALRRERIGSCAAALVLAPSLPSVRTQQAHAGRPDTLGTVRLAVGDRVVYGNHGIGRISARTEQTVLGESQEVVVVELGELTATLPLELAKRQLRAPASEADVRLVRHALRDDAPLNSSNWLSRRQATLDKLTEGTPVRLAEIVSEGAQRTRVRLASGNKHLSSSESEIFVRARRLLSEEIAVALDVDSAAADTWIDEQLARGA